MQVPFNRPLVIGTEQENVLDAISSGHTSANGKYTQLCSTMLEGMGYQKALLTTSCTSALEMAALLLDIGPGDEIIIPSYAFVTTANAFATKGATIVFADSLTDHPNVDSAEVERLVTPKTKAIVALHYGGVSCDMGVIIQTAEKHGIAVIEDNAQGIGSKYLSKPLGSIGDFGAVSFHDSKNVHCGEGGAIFVNRKNRNERADVVWDKGTNRKAFQNGKVNQYGWVDLGSSYYPSELNAAFLAAQLKELEKVNSERKNLWDKYHSKLESLEKQGVLKRPNVPGYATHNAHIYYLETKNKAERDNLIEWLKKQGIGSAFHFQSLHKSPYFKNQYNGPQLPNSDRFSDTLVRLPLYFDLGEKQELVIEKVLAYYQQ